MESAVVFAGVSPHPPIIVPEIGGDRLAECMTTVRGVERMMQRLVASRPDTVVIISPHAPLDPRSFSAYSGPRLRGDFWDFGAPEVEFNISNDLVLLSRLAALCQERNIPLWLVPAGRRLDHGTMVPLYYLVKAGWTSKVAVVGLSFLPGREHVRFGEAIAEAAAQVNLRLAICASGDMSHRLKPDAPAGFSERAHLYDEAIVAALREGDFEKILAIDPDLREEAGEDIYRSLLIAYGAIGRKLHRTEVFSYEGPFGVGYMAAVLADYSASDNGSKELSAEGDRGERSDMESSPDSDSAPEPAAAAQPEIDLPALARQSVAYYLSQGKIMPAPEPVSGRWARPSGVFVSIKTREGELRGCVGTIQPTRKTIVEEVIHNAVSAATADPRFPPVTADELDRLVFSVDVLSPPERVAGPDDLDPSRYGLIVESADGRRGLLLPDLPGITTVERQIELTLRKAGIPPGTPVTYWRFMVERLKEKSE